VWAPLHATVMPFILRGVGLLGMDSEMPIGPRRELWERLGDSLTPQHLSAVPHDDRDIVKAHGWGFFRRPPFRLIGPAGRA
ncbi:MAG: hypothetical protein WBW27_23575, partial [Pseudolabrys sp.]|jgi:hypothetical protein